MHLSGCILKIISIFHSNTGKNIKLLRYFPLEWRCIAIKYTTWMHVFHSSTCWNRIEIGFPTQVEFIFFILHLIQVKIIWYFMRKIVTFHLNSHSFNLYPLNSIKISSKWNAYKSFLFVFSSLVRLISNFNREKCGMCPSKEWNMKKVKYFPLK